MEINTDIFAKQDCSVPIDKTEFKTKVKFNNYTSPVIQRTQFSFILSWACTSHKLQCLGLVQL